MTELEEVQRTRNCFFISRGEVVGLLFREPKVAFPPFHNGNATVVLVLCQNGPTSQRRLVQGPRMTPAGYEIEKCMM